MEVIEHMRIGYAPGGCLRGWLTQLGYSCLALRESKLVTTAGYEAYMYRVVFPLLPRDTQAQLRHSDPSVTLRHYQKSIPTSVRAAAVALESELIGETGQSIRTGFEQVRN